MELEPIDPDTAIELYIAEKETEFSAATLRSRESRLGHFRRWCAWRDITNLNELSSRKLQEYKLWRRNEGDLSKVTVKTQVDTLRVSIRWLESIDGVSRERLLETLEVIREEKAEGVERVPKLTETR